MDRRNRIKEIKERWERYHRRRASSFTEVAAITLQKWRGVPSHFNEGTSFDAAIFGIMAVSVLLAVLAIIVLLAWVVIAFRGNAGERLAAIVGLLSVVAAGYIGNQMIAVGTAETLATGTVPYEVVFGAEGSAKLAHFVGMHIIQYLALVAILTSARRRLAVVALGSVGALAVFVSVTLTAYAGRSWVAPDIGVGALGVAGVLICLASLTSSLRSFGAREVGPKERTAMPVG